MRRHLIIFGAVALVVWVLGAGALVWSWPHLFYNSARRNVVERGLGIQAGGIPVNTLYTMPTLASPSLSKSALVLTGNRDTLYTVGALDLSKGPQVLHTPDMGGRYYSIELFDPSLDIFGVVSRRTRGTAAADYLIAGPHWQGQVPAGMTRIAAPSNSVMLLGRVLVEGDADVPTAYGLAKQIELAPLAGR